jgi:hypothetical protein
MLSTRFNVHRGAAMMKRGAGATSATSPSIRLSRISSRISRRPMSQSNDEATTSHPSLGNNISPSEAHNALSMQTIGSWTVSLTIVAMLAIEPALAATSGPHAQPTFDLAENQEFWGNVARYGRYFVTVMLGTGYVMLRPIVGMFKNPLTGLLAVALVSGAVYGTKITLDAMLGLGGVAQVEYSSSNFM